MSENQKRNQSRAFADLVSIDAWHEEFTSEFRNVSLHTHVVFGRAPFGGEPESDVSFRLSVTQAELVLVIPEAEPAMVDKRNVARFAKGTIGKKKTVSETEAAANAKASGKMGLGKSGVSAGLETDGSASIAKNHKETIERNEDITGFEITQSKDGDDNYRWVIEVDGTKYLDGSPWDATDTPIANIIATNKSKLDSLPPSIRLEVRCRRENLIIEEINIKDEKKAFTLSKKKKGHDLRIKAAEAYIRNRLVNEGLEARDINEDFATIILGSVAATAMPRNI